MADAYRVEDSNNLMVLMGDDFNFSDAEDYFKKSQKFIEYFNETTGKMFNIELKFSTPSMYIEALADANVDWPTRHSDMFPYKDESTSYWTGYYTSRPQLKSYIRKASAAYHGASKLLALTGITNIRASDNQAVRELMTDLSHMETVLAEMQNKETITGTSSMRVTQDNLETLSLALTSTYQVYSKLIHHFMKINYVQGKDSQDWLWCNHLNSTYQECPWGRMGDKSGNKIGIAIHNPNRYTLDQVKFPVPNRKFKVSFNHEMGKDGIRHYNHGVFCLSETECEITIDCHVPPEGIKYI
jgi:hypothetical protein